MANLRYAELHNAELVDTQFQGADLREAVGLTQKQLDEACGDAGTRLPAGLSLKVCALEDG
jgi:uncharacterized protein YjbI with pentapeptide repeats